MIMMTLELIFSSWVTSSTKKVEIRIHLQPFQNCKWFMEIFGMGSIMAQPRGEGYFTIGSYWNVRQVRVVFGLTILGFGYTFAGEPFNCNFKGLGLTVMPNILEMSVQCPH